jgi:hypothetical protein
MNAHSLRQRCWAFGATSREKIETADVGVAQVHAIPHSSVEQRELAAELA